MKRIFFVIVALVTSLAAGATTATATDLGQPEEFSFNSHRAAPSQQVPGWAYSEYVQSVRGTGHDVNSEILALVRELDDGDSARIAMYLARLDGDIETKNFLASIRDAIRNASNRGATVEVVTDGGSINDAVDEKAADARAFWVPLEMSGVDITYCMEGCISSERDDGRALNHHKFFLFDFAEQPDGYRWRRIGVQSSANFDEGGVSRFEQAIMFDGKKYDNVWEEYEHRFQQMQKHWRDGADDIGMPSREDRQVMVYLGPYSEEQRDGGEPVDDFLVALNNVEPTDCRISIVMGYWSGSSRSRQIVKKLEELRSEGCYVDAIVGGEELLVGWQDDIGFEFEYHPAAHAKFMLLHYRQADGKIRRLTYAGSHNFTMGSWAYHDDAFLRVDRPEIYQDLCEFFDVIEQDNRSERENFGAQYFVDGSCMDQFCLFQDEGTSATTRFDTKFYSEEYLANKCRGQ